jgi:hypothetical protein
LETTIFSDNSTLIVTPAMLDPTTLNCYTAQPLRAGISPVTITLANSNAAVGTITLSPIVFYAGESSQTSAFDPQAVGATVLTVETPAGFDAPSNFTQMTATVTAPTPGFSISDLTVGKDLQTSTGIYLNAEPQAPIDVTVTLDEASIASISTSSTEPGGSSVTFQNVTSTYVGTIYVHGLAQGSTTLTATAAGCNTGSSKVTVNPSGFVWSNYYYSCGASDFETTIFSDNSALIVTPAMLDPMTLNCYTAQPLRAGISPVSVTLTSSHPAVGTITLSPLVFYTGEASQTSAFDPQAAGTTVLTLNTPTGFDSPSNFTQLLATVSPPQSYISDVAVGKDLQAPTGIQLAVAPPTPINVTVQVEDPQVASISTDAEVAGTATITFTNVTSSYVGNVYVQGRSLGTTNLTVTASGYTSDSSSVTVNPSGFIIYQPDSFTTTTFSPNTPIYVYSAMLDPDTLNYNSLQPTRSDLGILNVPITSSGTPVGIVTPNPLVFTGNQSYVTAEFSPFNPGTTVIRVDMPTGFSPPSNQTEITVTVAMPSISTNDIQVGNNLQAYIPITLEVAPPSPINVTVTSNAPAIATMSSDMGLCQEETSHTFANVSDTFVGYLYVQGKSIGGTTFTIQAPGYTDGTSNITIVPSGFIIANGNFSTTISSGETTLNIYPAALNPSDLSLLNYQTTQGCFGWVNVPLVRSNPSIGAISTSPVVFGANQTGGFSSFQPLAEGWTTVELTTPQGFSTPSEYRSLIVVVDP